MEAVVYPNTHPTILGDQSVCGQVKLPKYVCLDTRLSEQIFEKQFLKIILDILW